MGLLLLASGCAARGKPDDVTAAKPSGVCAGIENRPESTGLPQVSPAALETHVRVLADDWTAITVDGSLSAQFEHTILVTETGAEILTVRPGVLSNSERYPEFATNLQE